MANYGTGGYKKKRGPFNDGQASSGWRNNDGKGGGPKPPRGINKVNAPRRSKIVRSNRKPAKKSGGSGCLVLIVVIVIIVIIVAAGRK